MAVQRIFHWKHGWIPLDQYTKLQKANGGSAIRAVMSPNAMSKYDVNDWDDTKVGELTPQSVSADDDDPGKYQRIKSAIAKAGHVVRPVDILTGAPGEMPALADGKHRVLAARELGLTVPVRIHPVVMTPEGDPSWPTWDRQYGGGA